MLVQIASLSLVALLLYGAFTDATRFIIPNWLTIAVAVLFPVAAVLAGFGWADAGNHLLAGLLALVLGMALFAPGWIGGGDAKLFAATALWFGWPGLAGFLIHTVLLGGVLVLVLLIARKALPMAGISPETLDGSALAPAAPVPYGIAIAGGALWSLPATVFAFQF
ncbi:A24 family peptidase [Maricaulis sp.]|uniref:A24 family peptidase n=1 Tax=Maricaulis sp. TaxID=1486257 RepID=UPI003A909448